MKKHLLRLSVICILILLFACRNDERQAATPAPSETEAPVAVATETQVPFVEEIVTIAPETPTPTPVPTPTPTPEPTPEPTPDPGFTIAWISDTQSMITIQSKRERYLTLCDWIAGQADAGGISAVVHTGDMVDNGDVYGQWLLFRDGIDRFSEKIPFFWAIGNHDEGSNFAKPWKKQPFVKNLPENQSFRNGDAHYAIVTCGSSRLLLLSVSWYRTQNDQSIAWLKKLCDVNRDLPAVLVVHGYLTAEGSLMHQAEKLEKDLVAACPNIVLVLSGHARGISHAAFSYDDDGDGEPDRTVNALMYDIQTDYDRCGYICLLHYDPAENTLTVDSYSPVWDDHVYDDEHPESEQYVLYDVF